MSFSDIIGNEKVKEILKKTVTSNNILHSYLFLGTEGIGKNLFANEFAKMILCSDVTKPCNKCKSCLEFQNSNNPDFMTVTNEEKSIKIEQIRMMQQRISEKPIVSDRKVYIINNSDTMTTESQNCLLKTLEEPPEYATIILIASNENKLLPTIRSRCIKINFNRLTDDEILKYVQSNMTDEITPNMISFCGGSLGKALRIKEEKENYINLEELINQMDKKDLVYILNHAEVLYKSKEIINDLLEYMNVLLLKTKEIQKINCVKYVEETKKRLLSNSNYDMTIDNLLMKTWEEMNEKYNRC